MFIYPILVEELLSQGWSEEEVQGVLGGNLLWVTRQVEQAFWPGQKVAQESKQVCLWGLLTTSSCLQVCGENKGQRPVEDEFPYKHLGSSCCSVLL